MSKSLSILILFLVHQLSFGQEMRYEDKIRISEANKIAKLYGDIVWKGFSNTPFTIVLVTDDYEYLINHPNSSSDFKLLNYDSILQSNIYYRKATFNKTFLATFPAVNGKNCIVVGTPENTNKNSTDWIITLLHEHFHQYTYNSPNYFKEVDNLNLSKGDTSGMWMINYPFPYENKKVVDAYTKYAYSVKKLIEQNITENELSNYLSAKQKLKESLSDDDYSYMAFQLWQEGIARYTEIKLLKLLSSYNVSQEIKNIKDFKTFNHLLEEKLGNEINNITSLKLESSKRACFYSIGMAEGLILDKVNANWRNLYLKDKFNLDKYFL